MATKNFYKSIEPIGYTIEENKQQAKRYYGKHQYFTTRAWNVIQEYIENYSQQGDLILDPFGGSGVTAIEALILDRRAIHIDITPLSKFLTATTALSPTSGIKRFISVIEAEPSISGNLIILAPAKRKKKLISELTKCPFVGHPMYMENKIRYGFYADFVKLYSALSKSEFRRSDIPKRLDSVLHDVHLTSS